MAAEKEVYLWMQSVPLKLVPDISKLVSLTGWKPKTDLLTGIAETVEFMKSKIAPSP